MSVAWFVRGHDKERTFLTKVLAIDTTDNDINDKVKFHANNTVAATAYVPS